MVHDKAIVNTGRLIESCVWSIEWRYFQLSNDP